VTALVFVCSIIGADAPSYEVDGIGGILDPEPEVPTLLYIGRRDMGYREGDRANRLFPSFFTTY
jgi:hypothetical protein